MLRGWRIQPVPPSPAGRRLRALILVTAVAVIAVEAVNLVMAAEPGYALFIRSAWALLRVIGFLALMRLVRYGRPAARPFGLILAVTTVFAVARLTQPRTGSLVPATLVLVGFVVLAALCATMLYLLYHSPAVDEHLSAAPPRRHVPGWVLTVRVAALTYPALVLIPLLVAVGALFTDGPTRLAIPATLVALAWWAALFVGLSAVIPVGSFFVVVGKGWARYLIGLCSVLTLLLGPFFCYLLNGLDGLLRDGVPIIVTAGLGLLALYRSRGVATWVRPGAGIRPGRSDQVRARRYGPGQRADVTDSSP